MRRSCAGFTMIELVVVLILIGIVSAVALPRMTNLGDYYALAFRDSVANGLRFAQKTATSHRRIVCANFTASTVALTISASGACDTAIGFPNGAALLSSPDPTNVVFNPVPATMFFQTDGRITSDAAGTLGIPTSLSMGGQTIALEGTTGYVK